MLPPEAEERFRKIEDNLLVTSELQRRGEARQQEQMERLGSVVAGLAQWMEDLEGKVNILIDAQVRSEEDKREMRAAITDLARTMELYLKARTNGGGN
jgi:hypothetical protein